MEKVKTESKNIIQEFKPGDKIYKLFGYKKAIISGNKEKFLISISKMKDVIN